MSHFRKKPLFVFGAKLAIALFALAWTFSRVDLAGLAVALRSVPISAVLAACGLTILSLGVGAVRWKALMVSYGGQQLPSILRLSHIYLAGLFYNTFLPANVGGDVLRGHITKRAFPSALHGYLIVFIERLYGLSGLLTLVACSLLFLPAANSAADHPMVGQATLRGFALAAALLAVSAATAPTVARWFGTRLPATGGFLGRVREPLSNLPTVQTRTGLFVAFGLSIATQTLVAAIVHVLLVPIAPGLEFRMSLVLAPLAMASVYIPSIAGIGVREAGFVYFFGQVGVAPAEATAASIAYLAVQLLVALLGGIVHVLAPLSYLDEEATHLPPE